MPLITQTPISDQINNGRLPSGYSRFDLFGKRWDSLQNHDLNERPFSTPNPTNGYDIFQLAKGSQTPISNQLDLQNNTTNDVDFSGVASATWTQPSPIQSEFANNVVNNKIPTIDDQENTIDLKNYFSAEYKNSNLYKQGTGISDLTSGLIGGAVARLGSAVNISPGSIPGLFKNSYGEFETLDYDQLKIGKFAGQLQDFRQFKKSKSIRVDGASVLTGFKSSPASIKMVAANAGALIGETGGTYQIFDRESYFGMGNLGDPNALRKDFTVKTEAATVWKNGSWINPTLAVSTFIPFRGDKVTVRDFSQGTEKEVYKWKRGLFDTLLKDTGIGKAINTATEFIGSPLNTTRDFIKFHFLGPTDKTDVYDIFTFRSAITSLTDSFNPTWTPIDYIGRADKSYLYSSFERSVDLQFTVYASSRDELKPMWRKLNYLATYTMPEYATDYIMYRGKYLRVTIGDLYNKQPTLITNLFYTLVGTDTTWDINLEQDPGHKQVPMRVDVNMTLRMLTDHLPQYKGQAYSLYGDAEGNVQGDSNWLSDAVTTKDKTKETAEGAGINGFTEKGETLTPQ